MPTHAPAATPEVPTRDPVNLRLYVADPFPIARAGLRRLLAAAPGVVVGEAAGAETAVHEAPRLGAAVVVLDPALPAAAAATAAVSAAGARVVAYAGVDGATPARPLLEAGAAGYVLRRSPSADLLRAVRVAAAGGTYFDPAVAAGLVGSRHPRPESLSGREVEVVRLIANGYALKEIAARLRLSVKTVETYKARAMDRVGADGRVDLVRYAVGRGWVGGVAGG